MHNRRMTSARPVRICEHLRTLLPSGGPLSVTQFWGDWGVAVVASEPDSELAARRGGLHAEVSHPTTSGYTYAWSCPEHRQSLAWGNEPPHRVPVSSAFQVAAHRRDRGAAPPPGDVEVSTSSTHVPQDLLEALGWRAADRRSDARRGLLIAAVTIIMVFLLALALVLTGLA